MTSYWKKISLFIIISVILTGGVAFFVTKPATANYNKHKKDYLKQQEDLATVQDKLEILQKNAKSSSDLTDTINEISTLWPDNTEVSQFIVQTETLAKNKNFVINNFSIQEKKEQKKPVATDETKSDAAATSSENKNTKATTSTQYSFNTSVDYPTALDLIRSMERLDRFNSIATITLSTSEDGTISVNLTGKLYYGK